jgi:ribosome-associated protein
LTPKTKSLSITGKNKALEAAGLALEKKAADLVVLDMSALVTFTNYFVICSGENTQQVKAIVDNIDEGLSRKKIKPLGVEGREYAHWVLMDYGDVVVHVFEKETRQYYELEKLWLDARRVDIDEDSDTLGRKDERKASGRGD